MTFKHPRRVFVYLMLVAIGIAYMLAGILGAPFIASWGDLGGNIFGAIGIIGAIGYIIEVRRNHER